MATDNVQATSPGVRLAEVIAAVSLATDLATGQPLEHGLRRALLAVWLGEELGLGTEELNNVYYVALLGAVGCTIEGAAFAELFNDEIAFGEQVVRIDPTDPLRVAAFVLGRAGAGDPPLRRARKVLEVARAGPSATQVVCRDVALQLGDMLDLGPVIGQTVAQCHEHWDGSGGPQRLRGEQLSIAARLFRVAHDADIFHRVGGAEAAVAVARRRAGRVYDPRIAERFCPKAGSYLRRLTAEATWDTLLAAEPQPMRLLPPQDLDAMMETIASFVDVRSPYTVGHSRAVAALGEAGVRRLGLTVHEAVALRRAGLLHDLGRLGVPAAFWNKGESLKEAEWERMKSHPSLTEVVLARSAALGPLGTLAGLHHERLDGSGYRSVPASFLPVAARVLAIADAYRTKLEPRPHRRALSADAAAEAIRAQARQGRLDGEVAEAVLQVAGHARSRRGSARPAELTDREVEVLRLVVRGLSGREIAATLVVSPKTAGHHIEHIYQKIGVSTRVGATLFALRHGLVEDSL
jgi:HD-GYP domain-containing protein (c-di-GMP phosphodiesterase class II)